MRALEHRIACGRLRTVECGVYAVGHRLLSCEGRWMTAVLAGGPGAVLSHRSAAELWGIGEEHPRFCEVTVPRRRRMRPRIRWHHSALATDEIADRNAIPLTSLHRTLLDLAAVLDRERLSDAVDRAEALRLGDRVPLAELLDRHRGRRGLASLRAVLAEGTEPAFTRSRLERRFLRMLAREGLPRPEVNAIVALDAQVYEADCLWRRSRLIVELDGRSTHARRAAFESDRERDRVLMAAGWRVVRVTWRQLESDAASIARDLRRLLGE